jgi:hypothetical protein
VRISLDGLFSPWPPYVVPGLPLCQNFSRRRLLRIPGRSAPVELTNARPELRTERITNRLQTRARLRSESSGFFLGLSAYARQANSFCTAFEIPIPTRPSRWKRDYTAAPAVHDGGGRYQIAELIARS